MKNIGRIAFIILLVAGILLGYFSYQKINYLEQEILDLTTETTVIETIGDMTCVGSGINGEIRGHANCSYSGFNSKFYSGSFYNHNLNGYGVIDIDNKDWLTYTTTGKYILQEGLFYNGVLVAGQDNENYKRGVRIKKENGLSLSLWKTNTFFEGEIGEFDENGYLEYGTKYSMVTDGSNSDLQYYVGQFNNGVLSNGYLVNPGGCKKYTNGVITDITKTVTNTVYRNNNIKLDSPLGDFYKLGSKYNPYTVQLELK